jgi:hypothetical protein
MYNPPDMKKDIKHTANELEWLKFISACKWENGYRCVKCGNMQSFDGRAPFSKKCTICKYEESATANTPFHGLKISIIQALEILNQILKVFNKYFNVIEDNPYLKEKYAEGHFRLREFQMRASSVKIAEKLGMHQKTVYLFLIRFMKRLTPYTEGIYISNQWFNSIKEENWEYYETLFYLMKNGESIKGIVRLAILG